MDSLPSYNRSENELTNRIYTETLKALNSIIGRGVICSRLLDLGCGSGEVTSLVNGIVHAKEVYCIDIDEESLAKCSMKGFKCCQIESRIGIPSLS